ncbi:MAG: anthranilate phosphoribosyltransferase [Thermoplasmatota archaeon]
MKRLIAKMCEGENLTGEEAQEAMVAILEGAATPTQYAGFLVALRMKGETVEEITGFARIMRERCAMIEPHVRGRLIDTCGTGGAPLKTFNISTISAFVAAGAGVPVAKHGNRAVTSPCGSADVLEALGANLALAPPDVARIIEKVGVGFLFAPQFHPAMRHASGPRRELGIRTVMNTLGPITNPARAKGQVLGVYHPSLVSKLTPVLANLGTERAMVVHGEGGLDEVSPIGPTRVGIVDAGNVRYTTITPEEFGFERVQPQDVAALDKESSARVFRDILAGKKGPKTDTVILNAACALWVGGKVPTIKDGVGAARDAIESGHAQSKLDAFIEATKR